MLLSLLLPYHYFSGVVKGIEIVAVSKAKVIYMVALTRTITAAVIIMVAVPRKMTAAKI